MASNRSDLAFVVLAAGKGTRLRSSKAKVLHEAGGMPLLAHVMRSIRPFRVHTLVVAGHQASKVIEAVKEHDARVVMQQPQLGTGHAVQVALKKLPPRIKRVVVLPGDAPLVRTITLRALLREHKRSGAAATILSAELADPTGYGRIVRDQAGAVEAVVEQKALRGSHGEINEVNSSIYAFDRRAVNGVLRRVQRNNVHREYYLTDAIALLRKQRKTVAAWTTLDAEEILGANTRAELAYVDSVLRWRKVEEIMDKGATLYRPDTQVIDPDVKIGTDTVVEMGAQLLGATRVGRGCRVGAGCVLVNALLADGVMVRPYSLVLNSRLGKGVTVGPFAHLRDGADIRPGARIGNYVEVKKSRIGKGAKAQHLTYIGDATIGEKTNVGAGTVTCNYDGVNKNPTRIGKAAFIGSGTMLVAPVRVGDRAYVAAGSVITKDVPAEGLGIARGMQVTKPGWARRRRSEKDRKKGKTSRRG